MNGPEDARTILDRHEAIDAMAAAIGLEERLEQRTP